MSHTRKAAEKLAGDLAQINQNWLITPRTISLIEQALVTAEARGNMSARVKSQTPVHDPYAEEIRYNRERAERRKRKQAD